jgi:hypothetical protein
VAKKNVMKLSPKAFCLAFGILWGLGMLVLGITGMLGYGTAIVNVMGSVYKGFAPTIGGAIAGAIWGFIDGAIGGYIFAWLYNKFL